MTAPDVLRDRLRRIIIARAWSLSIFDSAAADLPAPPPEGWRCLVCHGTAAYIKRGKYRECVACKREASRRNWRTRNPKVAS